MSIKFDGSCAHSLTDTLNTKTERVTITAVILTLFGIVTILGIIAATTAVCVKKRKLRLSVNEIQTPNNQDSSR